MKRTLTTTIAAVLSVGCAIAEEKQPASLKKTKTVAEYKSDFAAIDAFSSDGMAEMFYDEVRKVFKSKLDGCRISAIINDGYKNIGKVAVSSNYSYKQKGKEKASTIAKVENHLAKAQSEAEAFFQSINLDD
jgi:uncharacterized protein (DUF885 family)|tara:strand:+ start:16 stop:411 length:396 start_codon:yes stop_codon:yes gene_type:complete